MSARQPGWRRRAAARKARELDAMWKDGFVAGYNDCIDDMRAGIVPQYQLPLEATP